MERMRPLVYRNSVGKYRSQPADKVREVVEIIKPLLLSLGYLKPDGLMEMAEARLRKPVTFEETND